MTCRGNEVEHSVYTVVPESRVTLNTRLLGQDVVILSLEITDDLREAGTSRISIERIADGWVPFLPRLIVDLITEAGGIDNGQ